ncbi:hypothetical protein SI859A1_00730 [Aurantimonas manganoxydans SI85-9A1]|uniref:Uncharacterized protein n=1 Tax=Aurantimonas manganoxydans (strain ATCC BAA-1229 / DSM 21871 / SI85-9A1) TaxID=287752 RepID=Q1YKB3_AURMS|nr:hypothetical protein SI859A1_00730 [Aurantimonas manganoxydans SI85-9A1]
MKRRCDLRPVRRLRCGAAYGEPDSGDADHEPTCDQQGSAEGRGIGEQSLAPGNSGRQITGKQKRSNNGQEAGQRSEPRHSGNERGKAEQRWCVDESNRRGGRSQLCVAAAMRCHGSPNDACGSEEAGEADKECGHGDAFVNRPIRPARRSGRQERSDGASGTLPSSVEPAAFHRAPTGARADSQPHRTPWRGGAPTAAQSTERTRPQRAPEAPPE